MPAPTSDIGIQSKVLTRRTERRSCHPSRAVQGRGRSSALSYSTQPLIFSVEIRYEVVFLAAGFYQWSMSAFVPRFRAAAISGRYPRARVSRSLVSHHLRLLWAARILRGERRAG